MINFIQNTYKRHPIAHPWVSYGVSIVSSESDLYSIFSIAVLYAKKKKNLPSNL